MSDDRNGGIDESRKVKKRTITLALDDDVVQQIRNDAEESDQSLNVRINAILRKYVKFYRMAEVNGAAVIHPVLVQFMIQEIDETKFIEHWKNLGLSFVQSYFAQKRIPFTFDNFIKYYVEELAIYAGIIKEVSRYADPHDGKMCVHLVHGYDIKWSRIIGAAYSFQVEKLLKVRTELKTFPDSIEIKILGDKY